jgi:hypothetical protein
MNEITLLSEAGPQAPPLTPAARNQARAALLAEIDAVGHGRGRRLRRPSRRTAVRIGLAVATAAAAWTAAVVIAAPDPVGPPPGSVRLVAFQPPTFPLSLDPVPQGMRPAFSGDGDGAGFADYRSADGSDRFAVGVGEAEPDLQSEYENYDITGTDEVSVEGRDAAVVRGSRDEYCEDGLTVCERRGFADLVWQRRDGQWVSLRGEGRYSRTTELVTVAEALVDRPQPVILQVHLAPAGWSVQFYKDGRILVLAADGHPDQTLSVHLPLPEDVIPADQVATSIEAPAGPVVPVTVNARPAQLVATDHGRGMTGWYLQAQFPDGTTFVVQAPGAFTQDQVLEFAAQVTYTPPA